MLNADDKLSPPPPDTGPETLNQKAAKVIAAQLTSSMTLPGQGSEKPIQIPAFRTEGMPPHMAEEVTKTATVIGEALVNAITVDDGKTLVPNDELAQLYEQRDIAAGITPPVIALCCPHGQAIIEVTANRPRMQLNPAQLKAITGKAECSHG